jgi:hypothetical protein
MSELHCARTRSGTLRMRRAKPLACEHERGRHRDAPVLEHHHVHRDAVQRCAVWLGFARRGGGCAGGISREVRAGV